MQWPWSSQRALQLHLEQVRRTAFELQLRMKVGEKVERVKLDQDIEANVAVHTEASR